MPPRNVDANNKPAHLRATAMTVALTSLVCLGWYCFAILDIGTYKRFDPSRSRRLAASTYDDPKSVEAKPPAPAAPSQPTGLRLLLIGDPIMHGQYLALTYYLCQGHWADEQVFGGENAAAGDVGDFYAQTSASLSPYEVCDCSDQEGERRTFRVYHDPSLDNTVVYLPAPSSTTAADQPPFFARLWPCVTLGKLGQGADPATYAEQELARPNRQHNFIANRSWSEVVKFLPQHMFVGTTEEYRRPTHVVISAGLQGGGLCGNVDERRRIVDAATSNGMALVWQTSLELPGNDSGGTCGGELDMEMCNMNEVICIHSHTTLSEAAVGTAVQTSDFVQGDSKMPSYEKPLYRVLSTNLFERMGNNV